VKTSGQRSALSLPVKMFAFTYEIFSNSCYDVMMRITIVLTLLLLAGVAARGKGTDWKVERGSKLEKELGYKLSVQDKHDEWRSQGSDTAIPIEGSASEYVVKFRAAAAGKLNELSGLTLTVKRAGGIIMQVPLAIRSMWNKENEVDVQFLIKKDVINDAELTLSCQRHSEAGGSYNIRLRDYAPGNESVSQSPTLATLLPGPYHVIRLATLEDTGEQVAMLDFKVFKTIEALKEHIAKLPGGSEIYFQRWLGPTGGLGWNNKFIKATDGIRTFCVEHHKTLTLSAVQPYY
jgi:hypothetical protein